MTRDEADKIARAGWPTGFAYEQRKYTGQETPDANGWILPKGDIFQYEIGYTRKGKRGARLTTIKGRSAVGYAEAIEDAINNTRGLRCHDRLAAAMGNYKARFVTKP